jgi:hypothetical protein
MPEQYIHTLIAGRVDFAPQPHQVPDFLNDLVKLGASPLQAKLRVMKPSGRFARSSTLGRVNINHFPCPTMITSP